MSSVRTSVLLLVVSGITVSLGCERNAPTASPRPTTSAQTPSSSPLPARSAPQGIAPAPKTSASSAPSVAASAPAPVVLPNGPEVVASLFTVGRQSKFQITDDVDTHSDKGGTTTTKGQVSMRVERTFKVGEIIVAELAWSMPEGFEWVALPRRWALRDGAVYTLDGPFGSESVIVDESTIPAVVSKLKPVLAAATAKRTESGSAPCTDHEEPGNYGPQSVHVCFDKQGIVSWSEHNRNGPRTLEVKRVR